LKKARIIFSCLSVIAHLTISAEQAAVQNLVYDVPLFTAIALGEIPSLIIESWNEEGAYIAQASGSYSLSCNGTNYSLQANLISQLPNLDLTIQVSPPANAISKGPVLLTLSNQIVVSNITKTKIQNGTIIYTLSSKQKHVPPKAGHGEALVTFTISPG
jgi:hypothetical protein